MSRYFRCMYLQKHVRTLTALRCGSCIYNCKQLDYKFKDIDSLSSTGIFRSEARYISVKVPIVKSNSQLDEEKFSDSDSDGEHDNILESIMKVGKPLTSLEWENVKVEACSKKKGLNSCNIDAIVMMYCSKYDQLGIGLSYVEHLSKIGKKLNVATVSNFMRLCYNCRYKEVDEQLILSLYDELRIRYPVLDASTSESLILGLCLTSRWKESIELIDMIKLTCSPGGLEYSAVIKKAFDYNEIAIGRKFLDEMLQFNRKPRPEVYLSWLDNLDRLSNGNRKERWNMVEEIVLHFLEENDQKPTSDVAEKIRDWHQLAGNGHRAEFTSLTVRGVCKSCQRFLNPIKITKAEFEDLQSAFLEKVVIGGDVFTRTTPAELENFKNFVKNTAPYDIVLDGLNIAYGGKRRTGTKEYAQALQQVVEHFSAKSQKILVIGRNHMQAWPKQYMNNVYKRAKVFLAQDLTQDDPFLLYAALYSGMGTNFLSRDLMRSHSYLLKNKALRSTFKRWQLQHQYQLQYITQAGKVQLKPPINFNPMVQMSSDGSWHIPYDAEFSANPPQVFEPPTSWLCLTSMKNSTKLSKTLA